MLNKILKEENNTCNITEDFVLVLARSIKKLSSCKQPNENDVSERMFLNYDEQFKVTDESIIETLNEAAEERGDKDMTAETVPQPQSSTPILMRY